MPVIWLIDAYRAGERGQVRALVDALGWPCETKVLSYRKHVFLPHVLGRRPCAAYRRIGSAACAALAGPGDFLWCAQRTGVPLDSRAVRRPHPLCACRAALGSAGHFRPGDYHPQYRVPARPNVLNNMLTLHSVTAQRLAQARQKWAGAFERLPRPAFAVIAGGDSGPFTFGPKAAARLGRQASRLAREHGGSLLVSTSSRTSEAAVQRCGRRSMCPVIFTAGARMTKATPTWAYWPGRTA